MLYYAIVNTNVEVMLCYNIVNVNVMVFVNARLCYVTVNDIRYHAMFMFIFMLCYCSC